MRIGILEDDQGICALLYETLRRSGHVPVIYHDGWEFLIQFFPESDMITSPPFDAVLIDLILPGSVTGLEVIQQIRQVSAKLPIIVISAVPVANLETIEDTYPGVRTLQKPFKLHDVLAVLPA